MSNIATHRTPANLDPAEWCLTPLGYRRRANVRRVPGTHRARRRRDARWEFVEIASGRSQFLSAIAKTPLPAPVDLGATGNAWASFGAIANPGTEPFTLSEATWVVPPKPSTNQGQTIYLFNGFQHGGDDIVQPVLVYGKYPAGPDSEAHTNGEWATASFLVPSAQSSDQTLLVSDGVVRVNPGDTVTGRISYTGIDAATGDSQYVCEFVDYPSTRLATTIMFCGWCCVTLELWDVDDTSQLPPLTATTRFSGLRTEIDDKPCGLGWQQGGPWPCSSTEPAIVDVVYPT